jgi:hypothetical protein
MLDYASLAAVAAVAREGSFDKAAAVLGRDAVGGVATGQEVGGARSARSC